MSSKRSGLKHLMQLPLEIISNKHLIYCFVAVSMLMNGCGEELVPKAADSEELTRSIDQTDPAENTPAESSGEVVEIELKQGKVPEVTSEVNLSLPVIEDGSSHELRATGNCNMTVHDRQNPFEFEMNGRMSYRVRISNGKFVSDNWNINPLVDVTNETDSKLYLRCYAAFFNPEGKLTGCCSQEAEVTRSGSPLQLGSMVILGPQEKLTAATHFQILIYESEKHIGVEAIDQKSVQELVGRSAEVSTKLEQTGTGVIEGHGHQELRLEANIALEEPDNKFGNSHLRIQGDAEYDLYASTRRGYTIQQSGEEPQQIEAWRSIFYFEPRKRVKGVTAITHLALLDESGQLIGCGTGTFSNSMPLTIPEDKLFATRKLVAVAYETNSNAQTSKPDPKKEALTVN